MFLCYMHVNLNCNHNTVAFKDYIIKSLNPFPDKMFLNSARVKKKEKSTQCNLKNNFDTQLEKNMFKGEIIRIEKSPSIQQFCYKCSSVAELSKCVFTR